VTANDHVDRRGQFVDDGRGEFDPKSSAGSGRQ